MTTSTKKLFLGALVVPAIALAAACTSGSNDSKMSTTSGDNASAVAPAAEPVPQDADGLTDGVGNLTSRTTDFSSAGGSVAKAGLDAQSAEAPDADVPEKSPQEIQGQSVISKGQISLRSKDIDKARFDLQKLLDGMNGTIADEQSSADKAGRTIRQRLVLRVPSKNFGKTMDGISKLAGTKLASRTRSSEDVSTQVIDNKARVSTQRASLARIQALLAQATNLREVISIEAQLTRRQADLDSLEAQQKYLADQTSLSTINVYLTVPEKKKAADKDDGHNFFSGLTAGWDHLGSSTNAVLTAVGAVLPFAALLALIGFPAWTAWRRRTPKPAAEPLPAA